MRIYNTLARRIEPIVSLEAGRISIYSCGPTVYRYIHIGNLRTFVMVDWLRRALAYAGFEIRHVKNITDVGHMRVELLDRGEDKLIAQARREGKTAAEIAAFYTAAFLEDEARLNILPAHIFPRATEHIPQMITIIAGLLERGLAYQSGGNVYYDVARFPGYGKLSGNLLAQLLEGVRDRADMAKRSPEDFALWKAAEPGREIAWDSPWGCGFPGWHIECSAMSMHYLGSRFDIHTGGVDNIFPHHEDEIAQSEGYTGAPIVNTWVHAQHLLADGLKMAKSTGNAYTRADIEARGFEPLALRYLFAMTKYRARLNFTFTALRAAQIGLRRLRQAVVRLAAAENREPRTENQEPTEDGGWRIEDGSADASKKRSSILDPRSSASRFTFHVSRFSEEELRATEWHQRFVAAIEDDLNLPRAMAVVWDLVRGRGPATPAGLRLALLLDFDLVLGLGLIEALQTENQEPRTENPEPLSPVYPCTRVPVYSCTRVPGHPVTVSLPEPVAGLVREREVLRRASRYAEADALRTRIAAEGYGIRDMHAGPLVERRTPEEEFPTISRSADVPDLRAAPDACAFSVNLLARNSRADLQRCVESIARHGAGHDLEIVIVDNGSTDDTVPYLQELARAGLRDASGNTIPLRVLFADHNLGFAAGRNATMRASCGRVVVLLDTSIEVRGDIWTSLARVLADSSVGLAGPYGLVTQDLKEFFESGGPDVDAVEGYLMAFRRMLLAEVGWAEEKFRFYRLLDIYYSFQFKTSGYRVVAAPEIAARLEKHPHQEWFSLTEEERATKSKRNYDIFKRRWHHGQSLLAANFVPGHRWLGHDHPNHLGAAHTHTPEDLPLPGQPHVHTHQHWPDHAHEHPHYHNKL